MERRSKDKVDIVSTHTFKEYQPSLKKKVILLEHFNSYLDGKKINKDVVVPHDDKQKSLGLGTPPDPNRQST
jgi:hypothetical protein